MRMLQIFETTVFSDSSEHAVHAVVVPRRSFSGRVPVNVVMIALELQKLTVQPIAPSALGPALAVLASPAVPSAELTAHLMAVLQGPRPPAEEPVVAPIDSEFGERAAFDNFVPFEESPITLDSLGKLFVSATGAGIGAYAGFVLAGRRPLCC